MIHQLQVVGTHLNSCDTQKKLYTNIADPPPYAHIGLPTHWCCRYTRAESPLVEFSWLTLKLNLYTYKNKMPVEGQVF